MLDLVLPAMGIEMVQKPVRMFLDWKSLRKTHRLLSFSPAGQPKTSTISSTADAAFAVVAPLFVEVAVSPSMYRLRSACLQPLDCSSREIGSKGASGPFQWNPEWDLW